MPSRVTDDIPTSGRVIEIKEEEEEAASKQVRELKLKLKLLFRKRIK